MKTKTPVVSDGKYRQIWDFYPLCVPIMLFVRMGTWWLWECAQSTSDSVQIKAILPLSRCRMEDFGQYSSPRRDKRRNPSFGKSFLEIVIHLRIRYFSTFRQILSIVPTLIELLCIEVVSDKNFLGEKNRIYGIAPAMDKYYQIQLISHKENRNKYFSAFFIRRIDYY